MPTLTKDYPLCQVSKANLAHGQVRAVLRSPGDFSTQSTRDRREAGHEEFHGGTRASPSRQVRDHNGLEKRYRQVGAHNGRLWQIRAPSKEWGQMIRGRRC